MSTSDVAVDLRQPGVELRLGHDRRVGHHAGEDPGVVVAGRPQPEGQRLVTLRALGERPHHREATRRTSGRARRGAGTSSGTAPCRPPRGAADGRGEIHVAVPDYSVLTAWPPNSLRSAASTLPPYESSWRERNRVCSESVITGAGTSRSIASWTVQRPSPESATQPLRWARSWPFDANARASSSSSHERTTEPWPHRLEILPRSSVVVRGVHDLEALGVRLHQAVLDPVVDHLHVVPGARTADVEVAALRGERREHRHQRIDGRVVAADHQAVADLEPPDPARRPGVDVVDALVLERGVAADVVVEVGVAAVDDRVAGLEVLEQLLDLRLGRVARRDHDPDRARLLELGHQLGDREGADRALALDLLRLLGGPVVGDDLVPVAQQAANHVRAHPTESDEADAHWAVLPGWGMTRVVSG